MIITCIVAPVALAVVLGFAFSGRATGGPLTIGVSGVSPAVLRAGTHAAQLPANVTVRLIPGSMQVQNEVNDGTLDGGVVVARSYKTLSHLLLPMISPGAMHMPGFKVVDRSNALVGQETAEAVAAGVASRLYAGRLHPGTATELSALHVTVSGIGNGGKGVLDYFAPSIAVVFLFIGSGLGMRSLLLERAQGTLTRMAAAPVRPAAIVNGKLLAVGLTGLTSILVVWGVTVAVFGANWGAPLGVLLMCLGATAAMCGFGVLVTSFARNEREAFAASLIVGLVLGLLGGNFLPPGALPPFLQVLSLGTPNGWTLVGFGRLSLLGDPTSSVIGPFLVLCAIAALTGGLAMTRVRRMVMA